MAALEAGGIDIVEASREGVYIDDIDGRRYIDCFGAAGCFNVGHRNPRVVAALTSAVDDEGLDLGNYALLSAAKAQLAQKLADISPETSIV